MRLNTDIKSVSATVHAWIKRLQRGTIFFLTDISVDGSEAAIRQIISRLVREGEIIRLATGIYVYPQKDPILGILKPSLEDVAKAIARRDNVKLQPTGALALNKLGLSTQVPLRQVYYTDGTSRRIQIGKSSILLKKRSPRRVAQQGYINALVIAALEELGPTEVDKEVKTKLREALLHEQPELIRKDMLTAPAWIRAIMKELTTEQK